MGLNAHVFHLMVKHCRRHGPQKGQALAAGYPDVLLSEDDLGEFADTYTDQSASAIRRMHNQPELNPRCPFGLFRRIGYHLSVVDIREERGCETIADLNQPADLGRFELVLDHGTIEHCFNIAQAAQNLAAAVKLGGFMVQHLPVNWFNHGFYNLNPTWFHSFYEHAGFEVLHFDCAGQRVPQHGRFAGTPDFTMATMVARRVGDGETGFPTQERYR